MKKKVIYTDRAMDMQLERMLSENHIRRQLVEEEKEAAKLANEEEAAKIYDVSWMMFVSGICFVMAFNYLIFHGVWSALMFFVCSAVLAMMSKRR